MPVSCWDRARAGHGRDDCQRTVRGRAARAEGGTRPQEQVPWATRVYADQFVPADAPPPGPPSCRCRQAGPSPLEKTSPPVSRDCCSEGTPREMQKVWGSLRMLPEPHFGSSAPQPPGEAKQCQQLHGRKGTACRGPRLASACPTPCCTPRRPQGRRASGVQAPREVIALSSKFFSISLSQGHSLLETQCGQCGTRVPENHPAVWDPTA